MTPAGPPPPQAGWPPGLTLAPAAVQRAGDGTGERLDVAAALAAVQRLSAEIDTERLVRTLITLAMTASGASRALLLLLRDGHLMPEAPVPEAPMLEAFGTLGDGRILLRFVRAAVTPAQAPLSVLHSVIRHRAPVAIADLARPHEHAADRYFVPHPAGALLSLPLIKQDSLIGILHLEHATAAGAFDGPPRALLEILASQAAISLENARLYAALHRSETFLALGQRLSRSGSFRWNRATGEQSWSAELHAIWRSDPAAGPLPLSRLRRRLHPEDRATLGAILRRPAEHLSPEPQGLRILVPGAEPRQVELLLAAAEPGVFVGVLTDVTERRTTEAALRNARAELARTAQRTMMAELAASIAHEINQPLATIIGQAGAAMRWLRRPQPEIGEALAGLQDIVSDGQRAADIIRALRAIARHAPPERRPIAIGPLVRKVARLVAAEVEARGAALALELETDGTVVAADPVQLEQVLLNLITNAADAMEAVTDRAHRIIIRARREPGRGTVEVLVADTGHGIPPGALAQVFEPFFTTKPSGLGMGLSICRSIAEAHGGSLACLASSSAGSLFQLRLPVEPDGA